MKEKEFFTVVLEPHQYEYFYDFWFLAGNFVFSLMLSSSDADQLREKLEEEMEVLEEKVLEKVGERSLSSNIVFDDDIAWLFPLEEMLHSSGIEDFQDDDVEALEEFMAFLLGLSLELHEGVLEVLAEESERLRLSWVFRGEGGKDIAALRERISPKELAELQYGSIAIALSVVDLIFFKSSKYLM